VADIANALVLTLCVQSSCARTHVGAKTKALPHNNIME
jgi:hypothetical protein